MSFGNDRRTPKSTGAREEIKALALTIVTCRACPRLVEWRERAATAAPLAFRSEQYWAKPLPGFGDPAARLLIVGLAPAANGGNRTGRMFTGDRSGDFLVAALYRAEFANQATSKRRDDGLVLDGCFITAAVRCAPPRNRPTTDERDRCAPFLLAEAELLSQVRVVLALGAFAFEAVWRLFESGIRTRRPKFVHGAEIALSPSPTGAERTLLCTYHPSQRNVFTGLLTAEMFDAVLGRARELCG